ncbi:translation initiation factor 1A/IF-1 [Mariannaea sp. PMI_226]|nr:translation initiation factor 1A/IF-1 [Mariannaea sp. PMI_226]
MGRSKRSILAAAEESMTPPFQLEPNQSLVRVVKNEGNNHFTCELPNTKLVYLELAQRFRNTIWIKRGGFVLAEIYEDAKSDGNSMGEIINVVRDEKLWRKQSYWPSQFTRQVYHSTDTDEDSNAGEMPSSDSEDEQ